MKKKKSAKKHGKHDRRMDAGEDFPNPGDMTKTAEMNSGKKVRLTLDVSEALVRDLDAIRNRIGVDRSAIIKVWLHERVQREKESGGTRT